MRLLVDCTFVYENPFYNTGIQRVVRNIINNLDETQDTKTSIPIIFKDGLVYRVNYLAFRNRENSVHEWIEVNFLQRHSRARKLLASFFEKFNHYIKPQERIVPLEVVPGDVLVLLDSTWNAGIFAQVSNLKKLGLKVVGVIYDLIPIDYPQYSDDSFQPVFKAWIHGLIGIADGLVFISETVKLQVCQLATELLGAEEASKKWYEHFYLGNDLDLKKLKDVVRPEIKNVFNNKKPVFLMVSTFEPRKNHMYLLDTFDILWSEGVDVSLCFIGRLGWKYENLLSRINNHSELGKRFFSFNDATDVELEFCYKHSQSLLFPSQAEGFGLPIVEALQRGLPAMVSDIPVFHEVGGDYVAYFNQNEPQSLVSLIKKFVSTRIFPATKPLDNWSWYSWKESTKQFVEKISIHLK